MIVGRWPGQGRSVLESLGRCPSRSRESSAEQCRRWDKHGPSGEMQTASRAPHRISSITNVPLAENAGSSRCSRHAAAHLLERNVTRVA